MGGDFAEPNTGDFFVRLKPYPRRDIESIKKDVGDEIEHTIPGLEIEVAQLMEDVIGDLRADSRNRSSSTCFPMKTPC